MLPQDKLLLICALPNLDQERVSEAAEILKKGVDRKYFWKKTLENRIFPQTYEHLNLILNNYPELKKSGLILGHIKEAYHQLMVANLVQRHEARKTVEALSRSKIIFTPFKGFLLDKLIYPKDITRDFVDIDLLFPDERERIKAERVLGKLGFEKVAHPHSVYHTIVAKRLFNVEIKVELHSSLPGITHLYQYPIIEEFWDTLVERSVEEVPLLVMTPENMFLVLALHAFREGYIKLKDLSDMIAIVDSTPKFNWNKIIQYASKVAWSYMLAMPLYAYISLKKILNEEYPEELHTIRNRFPHKLCKRSYPIPYSTVCNSFPCNKRCKECLFLIQKEIPGFPETPSVEYFVRYFPSRLKLSNHFLVTYVRRDCGLRYTFKCYINMIKALAQISRYVLLKSVTNRETKRDSKG